MNCGVIVRADNGKPSNLYYSILDTVNDAKDAYGIYSRVHSKPFKEWFGKGVVDENGEPIIKNLSFQNESGETKPIQYNDVTNNELKVQDVVKWLQDGENNIISKRIHADNYWIRKGRTENGVNLLYKNRRRINEVNEFYIEHYEAPLYYVEDGDLINYLKQVYTPDETTENSEK